MEDKLKQIIKKIIKLNYNIDLKEIKLENPPKKEYWDYSFACFVLSRDLKKSPDTIALELIWLFKNIDLIESVSSVWPYLNIKLSKVIYTDLFNTLYENKNKLIWNKELNNKTIIVDYIWTNVGKPLHIGHMCTPNQWQVIINIYKKLWYNVISDSHIWDWWIIFWKLITAYKLLWDEKKLKENAVEHLFELYVNITKKAEEESELEKQFRDEFKLLSKWEPDSINLWEKFTKESIKTMNIQLNRLNIQSDYDIWESFYEWLSLPKIQNYPDLEYNMDSIVKELIDKKIAIKNQDWSVWVIFPDELNLPSCILQKRDGTNLYFTSDLCAIKYRIRNWDLDKIIYFVDVRQQLHLKQAFEIAKIAWWLKKENWEKVWLFHAYNWFISLKDWAMSTRKWKIIKLDKLLDEAEYRAKNIILEKRNDIKGEELNELAKIIGIWAIKYGYLKKSRDTDVIFDWDEFMTFEWNSWPYIQYAYVRAIRILEKNNIDLPFLKVWSQGNYEMGVISNFNFENEEEIELIKIILTYNDIIEKTAKFSMPHYLCAFSYELTKAFNNFYNNIGILNEKIESKKIIRLQLVELFSLVLKDSFEILGIKMPNKM